MDGYIDAFDPMKSVLPAGIFTNRVEVSIDRFTFTWLKFRTCTTCFQGCQYFLVTKPFYDISLSPRDMEISPNIT